MERKVLRVNLTAGTCKDEPTQHGMGERLPGLPGAGHEIPGGDRSQGRSLSPDNKMIMSTGPLDRHHGIDRRPLYRGDQGSAHRRHRVLEIGGLFGAENEVRRLGHDHLRRQVTQAGLSIRRERQGRTARRLRHLWGKTCWETEERPSSTIITIRRSGFPRSGRAENQVLFACVVNDLHRAAGRSGVGAVMGRRTSRRWRSAAPKVSGSMTSASSSRSPPTKKVLADNAVTGQGCRPMAPRC